MFDQGLGDLFVVRVAGNVASEEAIGSLEYAVEHLGVPLVVVLGHECCGAVATVASGRGAAASFCSIVDALAPSLESAQARRADGSDLIEACADANIHVAAAALLASPVVGAAVRAGTTLVVPAKYRLESGVVDWL